jgi:hypothetical protein
MLGLNLHGNLTLKQSMNSTFKLKMRTNTNEETISANVRPGQQFDSIFLEIVKLNRSQFFESMGNNET